MINKILTNNNFYVTNKKQNNTNTDKKIFFNKTNADTFSINTNQHKIKNNLSFGMTTPDFAKTVKKLIVTQWIAILAFFAALI